MVSDLDMLLDPICQHLLMIFASVFLEVVGLWFSFVSFVLIWFSVRVSLASLNELRKIPSLSIIWDNLRRISTTS
jgi:hypothetical protein